jgi:hypothetical protein
MPSKPVPKVALGVVSYGGQDPQWWKAMVDFVGMWDRNVAEYAGLFHSGVSTTDINRNNVAHQFLGSNADWLLWIDADNPPPVGTLERLLGLGKPLVSGLYYGGDVLNDPHPIAYVRGKKGGYHTIALVKPNWEKGELLQVDAVGNGCFLNHRVVFEDIQANFSMYQRKTGGVIAIHKDNVKNEPPEVEVSHPYAGQIRKGILYDPIIQWDMSDRKFPFYMCQYNRTEDYTFCEYARELGYEIWIDTSVEVGHVKAMTYSGKEYREKVGFTPSTEIREIQYE